MTFTTRNLLVAALTDGSDFRESLLHPVLTDENGQPEIDASGNVQRQEFSLDVVSTQSVLNSIAELPGGSAANISAAQASLILSVVLATIADNDIPIVVTGHCCTRQCLHDDPNSTLGEDIVVIFRAQGGSDATYLKALQAALNAYVTPKLDSPVTTPAQPVTDVGASSLKVLNNDLLKCLKL